MRILFLVHRVPYPPNKGDKIRALWELKSLAAAHEVDLFCFYDDQEDRNSIDALRSYCKQCYAESLSWPGSRVRSLAALLRGKPFTTAFFYTATMARQVKQALATRKYDAVLVFSSSMAQYVEDENSLPRILDMIDVDSAKWTDYSHTGSQLLRWLWRREGRLLSQYECKIAQSFANTLLSTDAEAALLRRSATACARVGVLRHMVDGDYFDPSKVEIPTELLRWQPYVVFSGSMDYAPNIEAMKWFYREVFPAIRARVPEARLVIVGRNPAKSILDLGQDPAVLVTGSVPDVRPYLRAAAVAVAPMLVARGVQNKILESMAMGLPVSSSSRAAVAFPTQVADLIMIEDDAAALANKLVNVIEKGPHAPVLQIRECLQKVYGDSSLRNRLEEILQRAVEDTQVRLCSAQVAVNQNEESVAASGERREQPC
jgi:sugar transferase (PEP-CTERM/EpsH1 system associated)